MNPDIAEDASAEIAAADVRGSAARRFLLSNEFGLIVLIVAFGLFFALVAPGFTSRFNLYALGRTMAIDIIIGFSMMVVIVTGGPQPRGRRHRRLLGDGLRLADRVGRPAAAARARSAASRWARRSVGCNGAIIVRSGHAQLHHHAGDDEHLLRRA